MMKRYKDIAPKNAKGQYHGYQEWYWNKLWVRVNYKYGSESGYEEDHWSKKTNFHIK